MWGRHGRVRVWGLWLVPMEGTGMQRCWEGTAGQWSHVWWAAGLERVRADRRAGGARDSPLPGQGDGRPGVSRGEEQVGTGQTGDKLRTVQAELGCPRDVLENGAESRPLCGDEEEEESLQARAASTGSTSPGTQSAAGHSHLLGLPEPKSAHLHPHAPPAPPHPPPYLRTSPPPWDLHTSPPGSAGAWL